MTKKKKSEISPIDKNESSRRARFRCPPELQKVIAVINLITDEIIEDFDRTDPWNYEHPLKWSDVFDRLPEPVKAYLSRDIGEAEQSQPFFYRRGSWLFQNLISFRNLVRQIEVVGKKSLERNRNQDMSPTMIAKVEGALNHRINPLLREDFDADSLETNNLGVVQFRVTPDRKLKLKVSPLIEVLDGVDMTRIRRCDFCSQLFWAERIDSLGCSAKCSNALRQRRLRNAKLKSIN